MRYGSVMKCGSCSYTETAMKIMRDHWFIYCLTFAITMNYSSCAHRADVQKGPPEDTTPAGIPENRTTWQAADGELFTYRQWPEVDRTHPPEGLVVAIHGLSGAAEDFVPVAEDFVPRGYTLYALNLRGMGKDPVENRRGDLRDYDRLTQDVQEFVAYVRNRHQANLPLYLAGESLGGAAVVHAAAGNPDLATGLILIAPVLQVQEELPAWKSWLLRAALWIMPGKRINLSEVGNNENGEVNAARVTRLESRQKEIENSQHAVDSFTLANLAAMVRYLNEAGGKLAQVPQPVLVLYAGDDIFTEPEDLEQLTKTALPEDRLTLQLYEEARHNLLFDPLTPEMLAFTADWMAELRRHAPKD